MPESIVNKKPLLLPTGRTDYKRSVNHFKCKISISQTVFYFHAQK